MRRSARLRNRGLAACLLLAVAGAWAQTLVLPASKVLECMTPAAGERGKPEYDPELVARKDGGPVKVELVFGRPDAQPEVRMLTADASEGLQAAVRAHVRRFRLPCQAADSEPSRVVFEYLFRPDDGRNVVVRRPQDPVLVERQRQRACLTRISGDEKPEYPGSAKRRELEAKVLVRLSFTAPDRPPILSYLSEPVDGAFRDAIGEHLANYRLPCLKSEPLDLEMVFDFRFEDGDRTVFKDLDLLSFLGLARKLPTPATFDTRAMGCPFDLRVRHFQPFRPHWVAQVEPARPDREEFMEWLSRVELKLDRTTAQRVLGDTFTLSVPCTQISL